ncbi:acyltransferase [Pseudanabaena sp. FACHB-1998]|uniref:acyltransferase family protein n=1 Tax=Pseudanabaena sp. FACHB-1998 TaxID=2692858 RepID=UPI0016807233|nr:acyltransferase [Pseudanabaena sp. FACHB-1998]MBD2176821.1 acyltransferase [Pseudanabaena sp. FACHB-1998]
MQNQILDAADLRDRFAPTVEIQAEGRKAYDYTLEGLRGLAAIWVAYSHIFFYEFKLDPAYHPAFAFGSFFNAAHGGILIFFALSGYVIGLTNQLPFSKSNVIRYLLRRFIRLYPIYIIAIILGVLASPTDSWKTIVGNLFFLQGGVTALLSGNGVLWTLHYEIVYYIFFLGIWYFRPKVMPLMVGSLVIACLSPWITGFPPIISGYAAGWVFWLFGLWLAWKKTSSEAFTKFPVFTYILLFIATDKLIIGKTLLTNMGFTGIALAEISITDFVYFPLCALLFSALTKRQIPYLRLLGAIAIALPLFQTSYLLVTNQLFKVEAWVIAVVQMLMGFGLWGWKTSPNIFSKLTFFGSISYGIYVLHMPLLNFINKISTFSGSPVSFIIRLLIWMALTIGIAYLLELKMQPMIKQWFQKNVLNHI